MAMMQHPDFQPGMPSVWDLRGVDVSKLDPQGMESVANLNRETAETRGPARVAFVVDDDVVFGTVRMYGVLAEVPHLDTAPFRDLQEAIQWVLRD